MVELNKKVYIIFAIFIVILLLSGIPSKMYKEYTKPPKIINQSINVTPTPQIIYITVTPTPDNGVYYSGEYQNGTRKLQRPFSWFRENVSGLKDMAVSVSVFDYRIFPKLHLSNLAKTNSLTPEQYYEIYPQTDNSEFLFVFVSLTMNNIIGDDSRMWFPDKDHFSVQIDNNIYYPTPFTLQRIQELETVSDLDRAVYTHPYGETKKYTKNSDKVESQGYYNVDTWYLRGGESNTESGFIIYEIPKNTPKEKIFINGAFFAFGYSSWILKI